MPAVRYVIGLLLLFLSFPAFSEPQQSFPHWLNTIRQEAEEEGISENVVEDAFADVVMPSQDILDLDHKQPEKTRTFADYIKGVLTQKRIAAAKEQWQSHRKVLKKIDARYHVPPQVLLALWCVESNFGERQGNYSVIQSLATLAYDGRRSQFFHDELLKALHIMQDEYIKASQLTGSWAGAMGQTQFMPSSFLKFAVDFDKDGRKDIWNSDADALASIANYLHSKGWNRKAGWGIEVALPDDTRIEDWRQEKDKMPLKDWRELGFTRADGEPLPKSSTPARLIIPDDGSSVFLVLPNYDIIMDWNRSIYFATSVGLLADAIGKK